MQSPAPPATTDAPSHAPPAARTGVRLDEELPLFCERCGYALHGLPQARCGHCGILHFACPECGYHQPINTLRPTFQRILGRVRGLFLVLWVIFKLNYFGWLLFAWFAMGVEWSYEYNWNMRGGRERVLAAPDRSGRNSRLYPLRPHVWLFLPSSAPALAACDSCRVGPGRTGGGSRSTRSHRAEDVVP